VSCSWTEPRTQLSIEIATIVTLVAMITLLGVPDVGG
jgi:hypothetical protein